LDGKFNVLWNADDGVWNANDGIWNADDGIWFWIQ
jgi:hypothetical protein